MNPEEEDRDQKSARNTRSDALFFHHRLVSRPSLLNLPTPDSNLTDPSPSSTRASSRSANSFTNSVDPPTFTPLSPDPPIPDTPFSRRNRPRRSRAADSTDDSTLIAKDVAGVVTDMARRAAAVRGGEGDGEGRRTVLYPHGPFLRVWDMFLLVLLIYVVFVSVYVYSFLGILSPSSPWFWVERFLDLAFLTDIVLSFFRAYQKMDGTIEDNPHKIRKSYLFSWFGVDVLGTFPWDIIALGVYGTESEGPSILLLPRFLRLLRLTRLFRLARLLRMSDKLSSLEVKLHVKAGYLRLATLFITVTLIAHWFACLFFYFGAITASTCEVGQDCVHVNWFERDDGDVPEGNFGRYVAALYFSVYTITTIGYGDVVPENTLERIYVIVIMFFGAAMFAYVISQVSNVQDQLNESRVEHRKKMDQWMDYAKFHDLDDKLHAAIRKNLEEDFQKQRLRDEQALLEGISCDLRRKVLDKIHGESMSVSRLIRAIPEERRGHVYMHLQEMTVKENITLYENGDRPNGFYLIKEGRVRVQQADGNVKVVKKGQFFGEQGVVFERAREETAKCMEKTDLIKVPRDAFMKVVDETAKVRKKLEAEEALMLWSMTINVVEAQIRNAKMARNLREKAEADFKARGIAVVNRSDAGKRGARSMLQSSVSAISVSEGWGRGGVGGLDGEEEEGLMDGGGKGGKVEVGEVEVLRAELEERRMQVRSLEERLEQLQNQLSQIAEGLGARNSRAGVDGVLSEGQIVR
eukprot:GFKZ01011314.1.p1 GENE.GFKZ01011314.1~~GFKZ01011314.1.p1  ORF type:complete len:759 (-),score=136.18 GFKZ01011314.1:659-2905(-)